MPEFVTPPALSPGDRVAVVAPSSGAAASVPSVRDLGVRRLRETFDLEPVVYPTAERTDDYLREHPEERARDVHDAFRDPEIRGVVATIGGDDQVRVLRHLDPDVLREHPTRFYGMSDNTNLACYLWNRGVVSFYGGQLLNQVATPGFLHEYTERYLRRAFFEASLGRVEPADEWSDDVVDWAEPGYESIEPEYEPAPGWRWERGDGVVEGRVWGGCLTVLMWQLAVGRYLPDPDALDGAVLALETSEERPTSDEVRRFLTCLGERGLLGRFDAVLVGRPQTRNRVERPGDDERRRHRREQREAILGALDRYNPDAGAVFDLDFGHTNPTVPVPIGGLARVDFERETLAFTEG